MRRHQMKTVDVKNGLAGRILKGSPEGHLLPQMTEGEQVVEDYVAMRLTLRRHPMAFLRARLSGHTVVGHRGAAPLGLRPIHPEVFSAR